MAGNKKAIKREYKKKTENANQKTTRKVMGNKNLEH